MHCCSTGRESELCWPACCRTHTSSEAGEPCLLCRTPLEPARPQAPTSLEFRSDFYLEFCLLYSVYIQAAGVQSIGITGDIIARAAVQIVNKYRNKRDTRGPAAAAAASIYIDCRHAGETDSTDARGTVWPEVRLMVSSLQIAAPVVHVDWSEPTRVDYGVLVVLSKLA